MVKLTEQSACAGLLPITHGGVTLRELEVVQITSVAPYDGAEKAVSTALKRAVGTGLPDQGRLLAGKTADIFWSAHGQFFVLGGKLPKLKAATTEQTDAWACVALEGPTASAILARLCPLDTGAMDEGDVARSLIGHMSAVIIRRSDGYDLMVFRSMARTLVHEVETVMKSLAAQARL